eukprot:5490040-Prymnesium_polylepis.1
MARVRDARTRCVPGVSARQAYVRILLCDHEEHLVVAAPLTLRHRVDCGPVDVPVVKDSRCRC